MQTLKPDVRNRILSSATEAFLTSGYTRASMRDIAEKSGITAGNIYRYFSGKEELFEVVVHDVYKAIESIGSHARSVRQAVWSGERSIDIAQDQGLRDIITLFVRHRKEIVILMNKAGGSRFECTGQVLRRLFVTKIDRDVFGTQEGASVNLRILSEALINACVDGIVQICASDMSDDESFRNIYSLLVYIFEDAQERVARTLEKVEVE